MPDPIPSYRRFEGLVFAFVALTTTGYATLFLYVRGRALIAS